jgi:hypothetical protein
MLQNHAAAQFPNLDQVMFQQDGGPTKWAVQYRDYINVKFPSRWMVVGGPNSWIPRSIDINPLEFFLYGFVKNILYRREVNKRQKL